MIKRTTMPINSLLANSWEDFFGSVPGISSKIIARMRLEDVEAEQKTIRYNPSDQR